MVQYANVLIFIFMNINENLKNKGEVIKHIINKLILASTHHQTTIVACFESSVIQIDKVFHLMVIYENYAICIFVNVNEYLSAGSVNFHAKLKIHSTWGVNRVG